MTVEGSERDPELTCNTEGCNAWATKQSDRARCSNCGGKSTGPKTEEGKQKTRLNSLESGMYASPEYIQQGIEDGHPKLKQYRDVYHAVFEAICRRHEEVYGRKPLDDLKSRYRRLAIYDIEERLIEDYMSERAGTAGSENPLVERQVEDVDGVMEVEKANKLISYMTERSREFRLGMKDFGLLMDPESKQADAVNNLAERWPQELQE